MASETCARKRTLGRLEEITSIIDQGATHRIDNRVKKSGKKGDELCLCDLRNRKKIIKMLQTESVPKHTLELLEKLAFPTHELGFTLPVEQL